MTVHSFPQIRTLSLTIVIAFVALIIDLNLKSFAFEYDFGSVSHRWLSEAYVSIADKLLSETQPGTSAANGIETEMLSGGGSGGLVPQRSLAGVAAVVQAAGQNATSKTRVCVAPAQAQFGQGNTVQADYGTPVRNALILMMSGPAVDITPLDGSVPVQMDAEAHEKHCDYILTSAVTVKRAGSGGLGRLMKAGSIAANLTPMGMMAHSVGGMIAAQAASTAMQSAVALTAQQQAVTQLSGFNGQIKSKDEVTVQYQLRAMGQTQPRLQNVLKGKSKMDGEDVLSPLLREAASGVVNEAVKTGTTE